ncbi:MAG TPA: endonuclease III domain-containing protein [bacterium]|nr:endonuclease III domain-containing protein [bacterium]
MIFVSGWKVRDRKRLLDIYGLMKKAHGHQGWWPGDTPLEIAVGAILTQNTAWTNVEKAIRCLKAAHALSLARLRAIPPARLAALIRASGYYTVKADRLKEFIAFVDARFGGSFDRMFSCDPAELRGLLLGVKGIGPETADSILLYAGGKPVFVVDAYTKRIFGRLGFLGGDEPYDEIQRFFTERLPVDTALYNDYHAQIVMLGKSVCRPKPRCDACPLRRRGCVIER